MAWKLTSFLRRNRDSAHSEADNCLAVGLEQASRNEWRLALLSFQEATRLRPAWAEAHAGVGNVLRHLGERGAALAAYDRALAIDPNRVEVLYNRSTLLHQCGELEAALMSLKSLLSIDSTLVQALSRCGDVLWELRRFEEAETHYQRAIALQPNNAELHGRLGAVLSAAGRHDDSLKSFDASISCSPLDAASHVGRGLELMALRRWQEALESLNTSVALKHDYARAYSCRAQVLAHLRELPAARESHDRAVMLAPQDAQLHYNRGTFLSDRREWAAAAQSFQVAAVLAPDGPDAYCNLGLSQQEMGQFDLALASYGQALAINPQLPAAFNNRGNLFRSLKNFDEAGKDYKEALRLDPAYAEAHYNNGQLALLLGNFEIGWSEYEWRSEIEEARGVSRVKRRESLWPEGASLAGKRVVLFAEQGLGDTIQFCRYASSVAARGARVTLEVQSSLVELLSGLQGVADCVAADSETAAADFACSLMSLPSAIGTTLKSIPSDVPYVRASRQRVEECRAMLGPQTRPRVGVAWSGNPQQRNDRHRSMALSQLVEHLPDHFEYYCLQRDLRETDRATLRAHPGLQVCGPMLETMAATAALLATMDLVISVDTSIAHLSGAMAKPTWILLPFVPDWRWLLDRADSPWYPTATLYRQPVAEDWVSVMACVGRDLDIWHRNENLSS